MARQSKKAFLLALGASIAWAGSAYAQNKEPEISFHPARPWSIDAAPVTQNGKESQTCAVQSEFNNGFIVRIDGSNRWVESLSLNFRQDALEAGKDYPATITVPGLKSKQLQARATQPGILVVNLRGQKDLYQAMRDSAVFDLAIEENNFRFYLSGFGNVSNSFERCMAGGPLTPPENPVREAGKEMDPYTTATLNESIELEKQEQQAERVGMTEISPENPQGSASVMNQTETTKLAGQAIIDEPPVDEATPEPEALLDPEIVKPPVPEHVEASSSAEFSSSEPAITNIEESGDAQEIGSRRLTEMLAKQIERDPAIIAVEDTAPGSQRPTQQANAAEETVIPPAEGIEPLIETPSEPAADITEQAFVPIPELDGKAVAAASIDEQPATIEAKAPEKAPQPVVQQAAIERTPQAAPAPAPAVEKAQDVPPPQTPENLLEQKEGIVMPPKAEVKVHKDVRKVEVDLTNIDEEQAADPNAPFSAPPPSRIETGSGAPASVHAQGVNTDLANQVAELSRKVNALEQENVELNGELKSALTESKTEVNSISNENWNLEKAAMRYNEAELQLKKLGQQLQIERAQCGTEKKELETQLFDPQITNQQQLARLADLERQLAEANEKLQRMNAGQTQ
jgi:hypothetical protein